MKLLKLKDIYKTYRHHEEVLKGVSLSIEENEIVALQGESGSGKTSILNIIGTLITPNNGEFWFGGEAMGTQSDSELAKFRNQTIGFVFQDHRLFPQYTVLENVMLPYLANHRQIIADIRERAQMLLESVGMAKQQDKFPEELSGGECQRVAIARALLMKPKLLLADEPTGSLDSANSDNICNLIQTLCKKEQTAVLMVTHSDDVAAMADRILHLHNGQINE